MKKWLVKRPSGDVIVAILKNKSDDTYSFVNLTKEHICSCKFPSIEDALHDMDMKISSGEIVSYEPLIETLTFKTKYGRKNYGRSL